MKTSLCLLLLVCSNGLVAQQVPEKHTSSFGIFYDEDFTLRWYGLRRMNKDKNYTLGLGFYYSSPALRRSPVFILHKQINRLLHLPDLNSDASIRSIMLANGTFTPGNLHATVPIYDDRPYASVTYIQTLVSHVDDTRYSKKTTLINIGVLGTTLARRVQSGIHDITNDERPAGWHNQISNPWEPTLLIGFKYEKLLTRKYLQANPGAPSLFEAKHGYGINLGYYTTANYEFDFRFGRLDPRKWTYNPAPLGGGNKLVAPVVSPDYNEYYVFASLRPTAILYNALLNGQFRESRHVVSFSETTHTILEFDAGIGTSVLINDSRAINLRVKFSGRSPEFRIAPRAPRWHYWGGIDLVYFWN